jgi:cytochrome c556
MRGALTAFLATLLAGAVAIAYAQEIKPDRAIKYRQGVLNAMNWHVGIFGGMLKGQRPYNKDEVIKRSTYLSELSKMPWEAFTPGSDQGAPTRAKPEVWKEPAKFKDLQEKLMAETAKLEAVAKTGDEAAFRTQFAATAKACDNCHDDYRAK